MGDFSSFSDKAENIVEMTGNEGRNLHLLAVCHSKQSSFFCMCFSERVICSEVDTIAPIILTFSVNHCGNFSMVWLQVFNTCRNIWAAQLTIEEVV
jgi:hypothetical protein